MDEWTDGVVEAKNACVKEKDTRRETRRGPSFWVVSCTVSWLVGQVCNERAWEVVGMRVSRVIDNPYGPGSHGALRPRRA